MKLNRYGIFDNLGSVSYNRSCIYIKCHSVGEIFYIVKRIILGPWAINIRSLTTA